MNYELCIKEELLNSLTENILPYWLDRMEDPRGGFYGRRDGNDNLDADAPKGAILNARILWSFSSAYLLTRKPEYLAAAKRAYDYIREHFIDREYGGAYWSLNADGTPLDTKKQFYAIAFVIYGLSEYYRACGDEEALMLALRLFDCIETHSRDREKNGYIEAATRDWQPIADMRLSEHDANASKTMNTHLHILEGYTNLLRALKEKREADGGPEKVGSILSSGLNQKFGGAIGGAAVMWLLSGCGYIERSDANSSLNIVQPESAITCLWMLMTFIPAGVALLSMLIVWLYPLGTKEMNDIVARLKIQRQQPVDINPDEFVEP